MTRVWNDGQTKALGAAGKNVLVSAAAGSGKTSVLTERVIRHVRDDLCDLREMLIVTFSTAAAAEMKERIFHALHESASTHGVRCLRQSELIHEADICTLHSLCARIIRENFEQAGVSPNFYTLSAGEAGLYKEETLNEVFDELYENDDAGILRLFGRYCTRDDQMLKTYILKLHDYFVSLVDWRQWFDEKAALQKSEAYLNVLQKEDDALNIEALEDAMETGRYLSSVLKEQGFADMASVIEEDILGVAHLKNIYSQRGRESFIAAFDEKALFGKATYKDMGPYFKDFIQSLREDMKKTVKAVLSNEYITDFSAKVAEEFAHTLPDTIELIRLYRLFLERYEEIKSDKNALDFNDLEHKALLALSEAAVCQKYVNRYTHIFVDEYQDTNPVQEEILCRISRPGNRFMVGDLKQSIYRFRQADPFIFRGKAKAYCEDGELGALIRMNENFRSFNEIIGFVNYIMGRLMCEDLGDIDYNGEEELCAGKKMDGGSVSLLLAVKKDGEEEDDETQDAAMELNQTEFEAHMIAQEIKNRMLGTVFDDRQSAERPAEYGDFAILLREVKNTGKTVKAVLQSHGIPTFVETDATLSDYPEVEAFIDLLRILDNFRQDIPLIGVMRSGFGGFDASELADIRIFKNDTEPFYTALNAYAAQKEDALAGKLTVFLGKLQKLKLMAKGMRLEEFLLIAEKETGFLENLSALVNGEGKHASLSSLLENAGQAGQNASESLNMFIRFLDDMQRTGRIADMIKSQGAKNTVKIVSIHKSKGLEFPVVFMPRLNKLFNLSDCSENMLICKETGIALKYIDEKTLVRKDTYIKTLAKKLLTKASLSEELRILYVGFTRTKQHLVLCGSAGSLEIGMKKWLKPLTPAGLLKKRSYLDWLMPLLLRMEGAQELINKSGLQCLAPKTFVSSALRVQVFSSVPSVESTGAQRKQLLSAYFENLPEPLGELSYRYPFENDLCVPSKRSVTQIKKDQSRFEYTEPVLNEEEAAQNEQKRIRAAQRGTITHFVMRHLDFAKNQDIGLVMEDLKKRLLLSEEEALEVNTDWISAFASHGFVPRIAAAAQVFKELPFCLGMSAQELGYAGAVGNVIVQGVIDLCFIENGRWVILDYKTDRVDDFTAPEAAKKYQKQLDLYEKALGCITGVPVGEKYIYFFQNNGLYQLT